MQYVSKQDAQIKRCLVQNYVNCTHPFLHVGRYKVNQMVDTAITLLSSWNHLQHQSQEEH